MFSEQHANAIRAIYGTLADADDAIPILDILRDHVGAEHVVMTGNTADATTAPIACSRLHSVDLMCFNTLWANGPVSPTSGFFALGRAVSMTTLVPAQALIRSEMYEDLIRPIDGGLSSFYMQQDGDATVLTVLCRSAERGRDFDSEDLLAIEHLMPHVLSASALIESKRQARRTARSAFSALDAISDGIVLLDQDRRVIHANARAMALSGLGGISLTGAGLHVVAGTEEMALQLAIRAVMGLERGTIEADDILSVPKRLTITRPSGRLPLTLRVVPGRCFGDLDDEGIAAAIVMISVPGETDIASTDELIEQFGLTRREAELAVIFSRSTDLVAAAALLDITIGTARQYLKSLFAKTDTHSQARLLQVLRR